MPNTIRILQLGDTLTPESVVSQRVKLGGTWYGLIELRLQKATGSATDLSDQAYRQLLRQATLRIRPETLAIYDPRTDSLYIAQAVRGGCWVVTSDQLQ